LLSNSSSWSPVPAQRILSLIFTLNLYEALLIAIAIWLLNSRDAGQRRDGAILIGIEAFFLVDLTWLNAEMFAIDLKLGTLVNAMLLILAVCKLEVIFRGLGRRWNGGAFAFVVSEVILLLALPGFLKFVFESQPINHRGVLPASAIYAAWWMVGIVPILAVALLRPAATAREFLINLPSRRIVQVLMIFAFVSIVLHLSLFNWVYKVEWYNANVAPLVLGLAVAIGAYDRHIVSLETRMRLQLSLPVVAMLLSTNPVSALTFHGPVELTPLRFAFIGMTLVYLHGLWLHRHVWFAIATAMCLGVGGLGASWETISQTTRAGWNCLCDLIDRLTPRTGPQWGIVSVGASFVLLALGALASVMKVRGATGSSQSSGRSAD
jgi:hypothetical protein